jgi:uncharacterized protein YlxW (UPF0749 family)
MSSDEEPKASKEHHSSRNQFRPQPWTLVLLFIAFVLTTGLSFQAVRTAQTGQNDARDELSLARIQLVNAQEQQEALNNRLNCQANLTLKAVKGSLDNSIAQDDLLLASSQGGDRTSIVSLLQQTRAHLEDISNQVAAIEKACA